MQIDLFENFRYHQTPDLKSSSSNKDIAPLFAIKGIQKASHVKNQYSLQAKVMP